MRLCMLFVRIESGIVECRDGPRPVVDKQPVAADSADIRQESFGSLPRTNIHHIPQIQILISLPSSLLGKNL